MSSQPCSRIQRRRARATSARLRSAARRLFFEGDAMTSEEARKRAAAPGDTSPMQYRDDLIQRQVRLLADQGEDLLRILLQRRSAPATGHWFANPIFAKALHPADRRTGADLELFGRLTSRSSCLQQSELRAFSAHQGTVRALPSPPANQCVRLAPSESLGNPDSLRSGRAVEGRMAPALRAPAVPTFHGRSVSYITLIRRVSFLSGIFMRSSAYHARLA